MDTPDTRICTGCCADKLVSDYYIRTLPSGNVTYYSQCKECCNADSRSRPWKPKPRVLLGLKKFTGDARVKLLADISTMSLSAAARAHNTTHGTIRRWRDEAIASGELVV